MVQFLHPSSVGVEYADILHFHVLKKMLPFVAVALFFSQGH